MRKNALALCIIVLFGIIGYSNTFSAPFHWDEQEFFAEYAFITDLQNFLDPSPSTQEYSEAYKRRYVGFLSFALNYHFHGLDVSGYHVVNLAVHLICAALVFYLVLLVFRTPFMVNSRLAEKGKAVALFTALLFVAHPVQTEAVTYVFQRLASLAALFYLLALVAYIRFRLASGRKSAWTTYAISLISAILAMKTKENAFTLPVVMVLFEFMFFRGSIRLRLLRLVPFMMTMLIIPMSLVGADDGSVDIFHRLAGATSGYQELTRAEYLMTQFRVTITYLRLLILPVNQNIDYHYPVYSSLADPQVLASFILLVGQFALGLYLIIRSRAKEPALRLAGFGIIWFFITLSVESSVIPIPMVMNEYRLYLPSIGIFLAAVTGFALFIQGVGHRQLVRQAAVFFALIPLALLLITHLRNDAWTDEVRLWQDATKKSPLSDRVHYNLANNYMKKGLHEEALEHYRTALELNPEHTGAHNNLGNALFVRFRVNEAIRHYQVALAVDPLFADARNNLGNAYLSIGKFDEAVEQYRQALALRPDSPLIHLNFGIALYKKGAYNEALEHLARAESLDPEDADVHFYMGRIYLERGDLDEARKRLENALRLNPSDREAARFLEGISNGN